MRHFTSNLLFCGVYIVGMQAGGQAVKNHVAPVPQFFSDLDKETSSYSESIALRYLALVATVDSCQATELTGQMAAIKAALASTDTQRRRYASMLLTQIAGRPDGDVILQSYLPSLAALQSDTDLPVRRVSLMTLSHLSHRRPQEVRQILEKTIQSATKDRAETYSDISVLLAIGAPSASTEATVRNYMLRSEISERSKIGTIMAIQHSPSSTELLQESIIKMLDDPSDAVRSRALVALSNAKPNVRAKASPAMRRIMSDRVDDVRVQDLARKALLGPVVENPAASSAKALTQ